MTTKPLRDELLSIERPEKRARIRIRYYVGPAVVPLGIGRAGRRRRKGTCLC